MKSPFTPISRLTRLGIIIQSAVGSVVVLSIAAAVVYIVTPQNLSVRMNAGGLSDGARKVSIRAIDPNNLNTVLYSGETTATVAGGMLSTDFTPPSALDGASYIIEVCTTQSGSVSPQCFRQGETTAAAKDQTLYSCPYYVAKQRSNKFANLTQQNTIELDNQIGCVEAKGGSAADFSPNSTIAIAQATQTPGISLIGTTLLTAQDGKLTSTGAESLASQANSTSTAGTTTAQNSPQIVTNNYYTLAPTSSSASLTLNGNTLSISGGNAVTLPVGQAITYPTASSSTDGILSAADWSTFAAKENSLTFSNGLVRAGDSVSLMSCAAGEVLKSNGGASWVCASDIGAGASLYSAGSGIAIDISNQISNTGLLSASASGALTATTTSQNAAISLATTSDLTQLGSQLGLTNTGVASGTYNNVTVDAKGRVTAGTNVSYLTSEGDGVVGNEVAGVVNNGGLIMTGAGTSVSPYKVGLITTCADGELLKYTAAGGWACATDNNTANTDNQLLSYNTSTNVLSLTNGGTVDLSSLKDNTDAQTLTITDGVAGSHTVAISGGNSQTLTESQALSYNSSTRVISLTNGGSVTLPADQDTTYTAGSGVSLTGTVFAINAPTCTAGQYLTWAGTSFTCGTPTDTNTTYSAGSGIALTGTTFSLAQQGATSGQILAWNGSAWAPTNQVVDTNTTYTAGNGITISGAGNQIALNASTCAGGQYLTWSGTALSCGTPVDTNSGGTVTNVSGSGPISVSNGSTTPTVSLNTSGVTAGTYGSGTSVPVFTVDTYGRVTGVTNTAIPTATTSTTGLLTSTDWNTFNNKENVLRSPVTVSLAEPGIPSLAWLARPLVRS